MMMNLANGRKIMKLATVFSGIGAIEEALKQLGIDFDPIFACDNGERKLDIPYENIIRNNPYSEKEINKYVNELYQYTKKPNFVKISYFSNHKVSNLDWYEDIRFIDGSIYRNKVDLFVGGSPCQSFSIIGKREGLSDTRGTLFFDYARLVNEIRPKVFIYENVKGMLLHERGLTWEVIKNVFDSLNYDVYHDVLNSMNYGVPQNRSRLFVVGFDRKVNFNFPRAIPLTKSMKDFLDVNIEAKYYLGKKGFEFVTNPKYKNRARVDREIISTQKANQQFNWNGDFVMEDYDQVKHEFLKNTNAYLGNYNGKIGYIRKLTPKECLKLMGFSNDFNIVVPDKEIYKQAGNSIVVNVLKELIMQIMKVVDFNE